MLVKGKMSSVTNLTTNDSLNAKTNEIKDEIHNIGNLATTSLNAKINLG